MKKIMSLSSGTPADETPQTSILTRMTKTVKYHIRQSFPYSVALFIVNGSPADMILSILVYTLFSRMFDLMQPPVVKHSIAVA